MLKNCSKHTVIQRRKELSNVKSHYTGLEAFGPARVDQVDEPSVLGRSLRDTTKLVGIKNTVLDSIKLKLPSNHLLNELAQCVE